ncbi:ABC transporter permease [Paenibacillus terrigena]|uniref:ABC transporter permease n=1 Tax=Paenibacillus terrigena TaxID=369333 RepID=UPI000374A69F|nr:ABC transporter permease [Paenibacillus terrigena]
MTFSMRRFQAIVQKEWKDAIKNPQVLLMAAMPIMFTLLFQRMGMEAGILLSMPILFVLSMTAAFVQASMVSEEKEKHTLRVLMLSPASAIEILFGKSFITMLISIVVVAISVVVVGPTLTMDYLWLVLMFLLALIMFIAIGTIIGLISRTVQETSISGLPVLLIFMVGPMFAPMLKNEFLETIVSYLPTDHLIHALTEITKGNGFSAIQGDFLNILIWTALSIPACLIIYRKRRFD